MNGDSFLRTCRRESLPAGIFQLPAFLKIWDTGNQGDLNAYYAAGS
jgi:hypothetical protein